MKEAFCVSGQKFEFVQDPKHHILVQHLLAKKNSDEVANEDDDNETTNEFMVGPHGLAYYGARARNDFGSR